MPSREKSTCSPSLCFGYVIKHTKILTCLLLIAFFIYYVGVVHFRQILIRNIFLQPANVRVKQVRESNRLDGSNMTRGWTQTVDAHPEYSCTAEELMNIFPAVDVHLKGSCNTASLVRFDERNKKFKLLTRTNTSNAPVCPREVFPSDSPVPRTGLVSYPGSGNTWARHVLQQLTGLQTGSVYNDAQLRQNGFPGEGKVDKMVAIKSHYSAVPGTRICKFDRQILLIRNPFDAFAADFKRWILRAGHSGQIQINPEDRRWAEFVEREMVNWSYFVRQCLVFPYPQLIVIYEDLKACLLPELLNMAAFLHTDDISNFSICCALAQGEGQHYRKQTPVPRESLFPGHLRSDMNRMLAQLAADVQLQFPVLSQRLLQYRVI